MAEPWERQPGETAKAWHAFTVYRDMGPERSLSKTAEKLGKHLTAARDWSRRHAWVHRVKAWDVEQDRQWQAELASTRKKNAQRNLKITAAGMNVVANRIIELTNTPEKFSVNGLSQLIDSLAKLEQMAIGEPTERVAVTSTNTHAHVDLTQLTDEERLARMKMLRREIDDRLNAREPTTNHPRTDHVQENHL